MELTIENLAPSPKLQRLQQAFEACRQEYIEAQAAFSQCKQETQRLKQAAAALEMEADQAGAHFNEIALTHGTEQRALNSLAEKQIKLRTEAEKLRKTAGMREKLNFQLSLQAIRARQKAEVACKAVRLGHIEECVAELLATNGLSELVFELKALIQLAAREGRATLSGNTASLDLESLLAGIPITQREPRYAAQITYTLPARIDGEPQELLSGAQLRAFELSEGKTTSLAAALAATRAKAKQSITTPTSTT